MKKFFTIAFVLFGMLISSSVFAQSGGKKKERKSKPRGNIVLRRAKSHGHADEFARGNSGRRGRLARLFTKERPSWTYKKSGTIRSQNKANKYLFKRHRSEGVVDNADTQKSNNKKRSRKRDRGNASFGRKKY